MSVEGAELIGQAHNAEREERGTWGNGSTTGDPGPRDRERESAWVKKTGADKLAPAGSEREREGAHEGEPQLTMRARGLAGLSEPTGLVSPFHFLWIL
jgi:hypothetical protein